MMRFAYADPPYLGTAKRIYGQLHSEAVEYDKSETHQALIERLCGEFPDGWALSLHTPSLRVILPLCPAEVRVMSWVKTYLNYSKNKHRIAFAWEPLIVCGGRPRPRGTPVMKDWFSCPVNLNAGFPGTKPVHFCKWVFKVLGMEPEDEFSDLFPGSGAVGRAWEEWRSQRGLFAETESLIRPKGGITCLPGL